MLTEEKFDEVVAKFELSLEKRNHLATLHMKHGFQICQHKQPQDS
jgi:hypothetical protein